MKKIFRSLVYFAAAAILAAPGLAQQVKRTPFDVTNYVMDVSLAPVESKLSAAVDVTFAPLGDTRSVSFELNGSLKVDSVTRVGASVPIVTTKPGAKTIGAATNPISFVQDQTNSSDLGPNVRIDLGDNVTKGTPITLRFKYSGVLELPAGGPLLTKR